MSVEDGPKGIDVSKWQPSTPSLAGLDFLIARASIGTTPDATYSMHIRNARNAGLLVGAYHANWSTLSIKAQVDAFLAKAGDVDFYFVDVEDWSGVPRFSRAQTEEFIERTRDRVGSCGLYMSQSGYYTDVDNDYRWVARWGTLPPAINWAFWQYQGSPLDKNRYNGSLTNLRALARKGEPIVTPLPVSSQVPRLVSKGTKTNFYDLDGQTVVRSADSLTERLSPYGAGPVVNGESEYRAVFSGARVLLVRPSVYKPVPDATPYGEAAITEAKEAGAAEQAAADQAAIDAAVAAAEAANQQLSTAAADERERIALARGEVEADVIRAL